MTVEHPGIRMTMKVLSCDWGTIAKSGQWRSGSAIATVEAQAKIIATKLCWLNLAVNTVKLHVMIKVFPTPDSVESESGSGEATHKEGSLSSRRRASERRNAAKLDEGNSGAKTRWKGRIARTDPSPRADVPGSGATQQNSTKATRGSVWV